MVSDETQAREPNPTLQACSDIVCKCTLRVWYPNDLPAYIPNSVEQDDKEHLIYSCTRRAGHDGKHGWCQGFDKNWTYQW